MHSTLTSQKLISNYPVDISAGTQMMLMYLEIIHYQIVGDTKAPLLRVIDTNRRVKNGYVCSIEPNHRKSLTSQDITKRIGKELLVQAAPELIDIAARKKMPRQVFKNTVKNTTKNQVGEGRSKFRMSRKRKTATTTTTRKRKAKVLITNKQTPLRSCSLRFFNTVRNYFQFITNRSNSQLIRFI